MQIQTHGSMKQDARSMMVVGRTSMSQTQFRRVDEAGEALETRAETGCDRRKVHLHMKWPFFHSRHPPHRAGT